MVTFTQIKWLHINKTERYSTRQSMHNINRKRQNSMYNHLLYPLQSIYSRKFLWIQLQIIKCFIHKQAETLYFTLKLKSGIISNPAINKNKIKTAVVTAQYLICSDVDLLREPVTSWTEGSSNVASFNHLHQVSDDLGSRSNTQTGIHPLINISNPLHCKIKKCTDKHW